MYNEQACKDVHDTWNPQDAKFDLDNCLRERRNILEDNENDYNVIGESNSVFHPFIHFKQCRMNEDIYDQPLQSCQDILINYLRGNILMYLNV